MTTVELKRAALVALIACAAYLLACAVLAGCPTDINCETLDDWGWWDLLELINAARG